MTTNHAQPQVNPSVTGLDAILANIRLCASHPDSAEMRAFCFHKESSGAEAGVRTPIPVCQIGLAPSDTLVLTSSASCHQSNNADRDRTGPPGHRDWPIDTPSMTGTHNRCIE